MITNNLLLKLKERNSENIAKTRDVLLSMQGKIEFLRDLKVELDIRHGESSYDIVLIAQRGYPLNASSPYMLCFLWTICRYGNGAVITACSIRR